MAKKTDIQWARRVCTAAQESPDRLTAFEQSFAAGALAKLDRYGTRVIFGRDDRKIIKEIEGKVAQ